MVTAWLLIIGGSLLGVLLLAFAAWWARDCWRERQDPEAGWRREQRDISAALADELAARWDELMGRIR